MSSSPPLIVADRYRLIAPLGQGGMGRVWRATDVVLHREVAIKELVPPPGLTPAERQEMRERSLREARAIARLNNINVVRVFDVLRTDADPWIVMEYVPSRSLQDALAADGPYNSVRTAEIGLGVLNALKAAHRAGVVHRDIKPGNVLIGGDGRVVLTDFGLATVPGDPNVTRTGLVLGSPAYIAPERARDGTAGPAADLWSLGATLYAAVEGQSPFARPSAIATLAALATENVPPSRNAGPLKAVLNGLLRKDPAHRIDADEAERLLARAAGRKAKISFPMSPTMRRPGVGRERPSLPSGPGGPPVLPGSGFVTATGSAPVVPTPRPPAATRPGDAPNRSQSGPGGVGNSGQGRSATPPAPPVGRSSFAPGRATVGNPPPAGNQPSGNQPGGNQPPGRPAGQAPGRPGAGGQAPGRATVGGQIRPGHKPLDTTKVDGPAVADEPKSTRPASLPSGPFAGRGPISPAGPIRGGDRPGSRGQAGDSSDARGPGGDSSGARGQADSAGQRPAQPSNPAGQRQAPPGRAAPVSPAGPMVNTARVGFTAADIVANRRKQAAPEHEASLAAATGSYPVVTPESAEPEQATSPAETAIPEQPKAGEPAETPVQTDENDPAASVAEKATIEQYGDEPSESETGQAESDSAEPVESEPEAPEAEETPAEAEAVEPEPEPEADEPEPAKAEDEPEAEPETPAQRPAAALTPGQRPATALTPGQRPPSAAKDEDRTSVVDFATIAPQSPATTPDDGATRVVGAQRTPPAAPDDGATRVVGSLPNAPVPGFTPSSRPAWTPMPTRPNVRKVEGVTIFGTTLTRRQAIVGAAIILTFVLLVGIILVQALGGGDDDKQEGPTATDKAAVTGSKAPAAAGQPSTGAASSAAKPSSAPASSPAAAAVPAGWKTVSLGGYSVAAPAGASFHGGDGGSKTADWNNRQLYIFAYPGDEDPATMFPLSPNPSGYQGQISLKQTTYQGRPAADWQYSRGTSNGGKQRVLIRGFKVGGTVYQIRWYTMQDDWDASQTDLAGVFASFKVN